MTVQTSSFQTLWGAFRAKILGGKFVRNVGMLTVANVAGATLRFGGGILVARWLGPELYGVAALVMAYPNLLYTFFDARAVETTVKYLGEFHARGEKERVLAMCKLGYAVDGAVALLSFLAVLVTASWVVHKMTHDAETVGLILVYTSGFLPRALRGTSQAVLVTLGRFATIGWIDTAMTVWHMVLVLGFTLAGWQVAGVIWGNAIATATTGLFYGFIAWRLMYQMWGNSPLHGNWQALKGRYREIWSFLVYNDVIALLGMLPKQLDIVVLGYYRNPTEVGYFKLARNLASVVGYVVGPLEMVVYPYLVHLVDKGDASTLRKQVRRLALQVGVPLGIATLACTLLVPLVLPALVGRAYISAVMATQLLLVGSGGVAGFFLATPFVLGVRSDEAKDSFYSCICPLHFGGLVVHRARAWVSWDERMADDVNGLRIHHINRVAPVHRKDIMRQGID
jgi:O-antigen/teichoic acid export membrane protein